MTADSPPEGGGITRPRVAARHWRCWAPRASRAPAAPARRPSAPAAEASADGEAGGHDVR
eukprot:CAMPEP_0171221400 /NCGR_PEP_ID=MMETSP0790-20130122/34738_1 /TAXON_ID=2925 /ORGANISM="Alexandrium catenella, Strain OF101" /LENGTH=59 /DNA_ID=CAMNT_0011687333 /DNA_START=1 /DNA_END=177 /DNA_ORIENTATION=-